jgi:hypothetical protein
LSCESRLILFYIGQVEDILEICERTLANTR